MIERLAIPAWQAPSRTLDDWKAALESINEAGVVNLERESGTVYWFELPARRVRGYAMLENSEVTAINFEFHAVDPTPTLAEVEALATRLGWELHEDDDDEEDED